MQTFGTIWNNGAIGGDVTMRFNFMTSGATSKLVNTGIIDGKVENQLFDGSFENDLVLNNSGTITGSISSASRADVVVNSGTVHDG